jgi:drug/metabolite transporter (DMT)-like permease
MIAIKKCLPTTKRCTFASSKKVGMNQRLLSWIILVGLVLTWGSSFILIKRGLEVFTPTEVGALRVSITFLFLLPLAITRMKGITKKDLLWLAISGFIGNLLPAFLFAKAQTGLNSSTAGLLNSLTPLFTLLIGLTLFGIKTKWINVLGVFIGLVGAAGLISQTGGHSFEFNISYASYIILATIFYAINVNLIKTKLKHIDAIAITSLTFGLVGIPALIILFFMTNFVTQISTEPLALTGLGYISILAIVGTGIAMIAFNTLIKFTSALFASSVTYLIPVVAILWGIFDAERFEPQYFAWILLIIGGVILVNRKKTESKSNITITK